MSFYTLQAVAETSFTSCFQLLLDALVAHRVGLLNDTGIGFFRAFGDPVINAGNRHCVTIIYG
jgi:hypothetical protein